MRTFSEVYSRYIHPDDTLILAVSGGVDSMVLLDLVMKHHSREKLLVAHFNHSLRGDESDGDSDFVAKFCDKNTLTFASEKKDILALSEVEKMSIEGTARKYRYDFLSRIAEQYQSKYILTAHHLDDRIETALFNLIRGTKLSGIHALRETKLLGTGVTLLRPLSFIAKEEILLYAKNNSIAYREDSTNISLEYQRNYLRHEILPLFERVNPEYRRAFSNFIDYTEELKSLIDRDILAFLNKASEGFYSDDFMQQTPFFQKEIIRFLYEETNGGTIGLSEGNIEEIRRFIIDAQGGTVKHIGKLKLRKKGGIISYQ